MKAPQPNLFQYLILLLLLGCVKPYEPTVLTRSNNFLVVDGVINSSANAITTIQLSRARALTDTIRILPEQNSTIYIEDRNGNRYALQEQATGVYRSLPLNLNTGNEYRLNITRADGSNYLSDYVLVKATPPIDSITWRQQNDTVSINISTHDPQNAAHYYRWEYEEDWEYAAFYDTNLGFRNGHVVFLTPSEQTFRCWKHAVSNEILLHTTRQLSEDLVKNELLLQLPAQSPKLERKYSLLARQFALTKEAYDYWQIIQRNTQQLGSLFDAQPSQLIGNIHSSKDPNEPVIGFVTAAIEQTQRIFIRRSDIRNGYNPQSSCVAFGVPEGDPDTYLSKHPDYVPAYYQNGGLMLSTPRCVDCRLAGGTTTKPPFWP